jgi:membrane-associated phospholipid phosphatase
MRSVSRSADRFRPLLTVAVLRRRSGIVPVWLVLIACVIVALTTADVLHRGALTTFDHEFSRRMVSLHLHSRVWPKRAVYLLTLFGQRGTVLVLTVPTVAYLAWRARSVEPIVRYVLALLAMTVAVYLVKDLVGRTAPTVDLLHTSAGESYPSGHLANAIVVWWLVWFVSRNVDAGTALTRLLSVIRWLGPICVVIGMSLLDYHWVSDFIAGAGVAVVIVAVATHPVLTGLSQRIDDRIWSARARTR